MHSKDIRLVGLKMYEDYAKKYEGQLTEHTLDWIILDLVHPEYGKYQLPVPVAKSKFRVI